MHVQKVQFSTLIFFSLSLFSLRIIFYFSCMGKTYAYLYRVKILRTKSSTRSQIKGGRGAALLSFVLYAYVACRQCVCNVFVYPEDRGNCTPHVGGERSVRGAAYRTCIHMYVIPGHETRRMA